ncbi:MAG: DUF72 domain-containing protein [Gammaproteobacteria bacterium]|jgi:uncharacterized protein YecE (DUF72 family)
MSKRRWYVGTSGYQYRHWRGVFYPPEMPARRWLGWYASVFRSVEINNTFYGLPSPDTVAAWRDAVPAGFRFALKFSRYGSHVRRLRDPADILHRFVQAIAPLGKKTGPILVQLPPHWHFDGRRLAGFLRALPGEYEWVMEFRDPDWLRDECFEMLERAGVSLCMHDLMENHPWVVTGNVVYLRFHGTGYGGTYPHQLLAACADRLSREIRLGRCAHAYFNNDADGFAPRDAGRLARFLAARLGERPPPRAGRDYGRAGPASERRPLQAGKHRQPAQ